MLTREEKMLLIVNADDFGYTSGVNAGITRAIACGLVTSVSVLPNQPGTTEALAMLRRGALPGVGVGVHLCLTKGRPLSPPEEIPSLTDKSGHFKGRRALLSGELSGEEVAREFFVQVELVRSYGIPLDHLDTHHHIHTHPVVLAALVKVAKSYGLAVRHLTPAMRAILEAAGVKTTAAFCGDWFAAEATLEAFTVFVANALRRGLSSLEIMTHPGYADRELARLSGYVAEREGELGVLCAPELKEWLRAMTVRLGAYADLLREGA
jgi:predicted glycoside hydrolase/deacetylase ChbG (UPF0249 family)